jgi:probable phosphoglycerate mutase
MGRLVRTHVDGDSPWLVISSPLGRAYHTAQIVSEEAGLGGEIATDERLTELAVGPFDGLNREEILALAPDTRIGPGWICNIPGGESEEQLKTRLRAWLAEHDQPDGRRRLVVCHGIAGRMLRHLYAAEPLDGLLPPQDTVFHLTGGQIRHLSH